MCLQWEEKRAVTGDGKDLGLSHLKNGITIYWDAEDLGEEVLEEKKKSRTDFIMYLKEKNIVNFCATLDCEVKVWMLWDDNWKGIVVA